MAAEVNVHHTRAVSYSADFWLGGRWRRSTAGQVRDTPRTCTRVEQRANTGRLLTLAVASGSAQRSERGTVSIERTHTLTKGNAADDYVLRTAHCSLHTTYYLLPATYYVLLPASYSLLPL